MPVRTRFATPRLRALARFLAAFLPLFLFALRAFGRAGGGEHYSGGGGSHSSGGGGGWSGGGGGSSGGGGGGGDFAEIVWFLIQITWDHPAVMVPLWTIVIFVFVQFNKRNADFGSAPIRRIEKARVSFRDPQQQLLALKGRDPEFDENAFAERTRHVFHAIQEAWFKRQLGEARMFMSDGVFRRFATLETIMKIEGRRDALADDSIQRIRIVAADQTEAFDILTVRVDASMRDTDVPADLSDDEARARAKRASAESFTELWTFVRRVTAKSKTGFDLGQGKCPNCGAPFRGGQANTCEYCGAIVNSGNYDWVLSEITQLEEYLPPSKSAGGLGALKERDPDAAPEILEDRALLLFWKWLEAYASEDPKQLQKLARPAVVQHVSQALGQLKSQGLSPTVKVPAVGGADLVAVEVDVNGWDRAHVDVRWSGIVALDSGDLMERMIQRPRRHVVQMLRKTGARSDAGSGLATERCGNCHAPLTNTDSVTCEFCGADLASGQNDWVLEGVVPYEAWSRPSTARVSGSNAFATRGERTRILLILTALARADGLVDDAEKRLLHVCAKRWGVAWSDVEVMLASSAPPRLDELKALSPENGRELFEQMVAMVKVDGRLHPKERELLEAAAAKLGVSREELSRVLAA